MPYTSSAFKRITRDRVLAYLYTEHGTTQKAIRDRLNISRPTVIQILKEFEEQKLIVRGDLRESTGGRRANSFYFSQLAMLAVGVELMADWYEIVILDLYGETVCCVRHNVPYHNVPEYYERVCHEIQSVIKDTGIEKESILGVGIVLQGLISTDGMQVAYGKILNCTGLTIDVFADHLPYPCLFMHDAEAATLDELWQSPTLENAIYIHLRSNVSGAIIVNRESLKGTELKSGVFEHMTIVPNGKLCYCGNRGCMDAYCSTTALLKENESLDDFFYLLRTGNTSCKTRWRTYLHYLALAINNLHMFMDCTIILGGTLARYIQGSDLKLLHQFVHSNTAFPTDRKFIKVTCCPDSHISRGAALPHIKKYLQTLLGEDFRF